MLSLRTLSIDYVSALIGSTYKATKRHSRVEVLLGFVASTFICGFERTLRLLAINVLLIVHNLLNGTTRFLVLMSLFTPDA